MTTNGDRHRRTLPTPPDAEPPPDGNPRYRQRTMMRSDDVADPEDRDATTPEDRDATTPDAADPEEPADEFETAEHADEFETAEPIDAEEPAEPTSTTDTPDQTAGDGRLMMPVETLSVLNWLGNIGIEGVESRLDRIPADDVTVETEQVKVDYAGPATVLSQFGVEDRAGARVHLQKPFVGDVLVLFPIKSANRAASLMLQSAVEDVESVVTTPMGRDALTELCNVVANGFVDEWATVFDTPFDTGAPVAVQNPELTLLHRIFSDSDVGLYLTASFRLVEHDVDATIFVFPGEERFVRKISQVDPSTIDR